MKAALVLIAGLLASCVDSVIPSGSTSVCERYASQFGTDQCGIVYQFAVPANTPSGHVELCIPDRDHDAMLTLAESMYGPSEPSPRFPIPDPFGVDLVDPPCAYQCPTHKGCNAYVDTTVKPRIGGCFCP